MRGFYVRDFKKTFQQQLWLVKFTVILTKQRLTMIQKDKSQ